MVLLCHWERYKLPGKKYLLRLLLPANNAQSSMHEVPSCRFCCRLRLPSKTTVPWGRSGLRQQLWRKKLVPNTVKEPAVHYTRNAFPAVAPLEDW